MKNKIKISFDFDSTLDCPSLQKYVKELQKLNIYDIWIITSRSSNYKMCPFRYWNDDIFKVAKELKIPDDHIVFTNGKDKFEYIQNKNFKYHLDDDYVEIELLNKNTKCIGILFNEYTWDSTNINDSIKKIKDLIYGWKSSRM